MPEFYEILPTGYIVIKDVDRSVMALKMMLLGYPVTCDGGVYRLSQDGNVSLECLEGECSLSDHKVINKKVFIPTGVPVSKFTDMFRNMSDADAYLNIIKMITADTK